MFRTILLVLLGLGAGFLLAILPLRDIYSDYSSELTLGKHLKAGEDLSQAYLEPSKILPQINNITWDVETVLSPFLGTAPRPGTHASSKINQMQFRSDQELIRPKPPSLYRIILTGGSTAFGSGAPSNQTTISSYLAKFLNQRHSQRQIEVLTFASPGWTSTHERIAIENRISEFEPDLVISLSGNNDVLSAYQGNNIFWSRTYSDSFYWFFLNRTFKNIFLTEMPELVQRDLKPLSKEEIVRKLEKNLKLSQTALSLEKINYIYILQPSIAVTKKSLSEREKKIATPEYIQYFDDAYKIIDARLNKLVLSKFDFFNLSSVFDQLPSSDEVFLDSCHFGDKGNQIIAQAMADSMGRNLPNY